MTFAQFFSESSLGGYAVGQSFLLMGPEARHAEVKRIEIGETIAVSDGVSCRIAGEVTDMRPGAVALTITAVERNGVRRPRLGLVQALTKNARDEKAIEMCTELGVDAIIPWQSDYSIVRWDACKAPKARQKWINVVKAAAKQSRRITIPCVESLSTTERLPIRLSSTARQFCQNDGPHLVLALDEQAETPLGAAVAPEKLAAFPMVTVVVGPEGGFSSRERSIFSVSDAEIVSSPVRLGSEILRSSTAGAAVFSVINYVLGKW